ncbi:MAG: cob(I)yrinic acid a,c-diamide adenosyltransferase [Candidatus Omnitrophica bacterium]|nr:cob(I)yrinic acid a,c-diamide adenosyltransferase [Candidatus Omnitrophota bacterium]
MSKIYTKTGDRGETSLGDGQRVSKRHPRITAFNNLDEVNSMIGIARALNPSPRIDKILEQIQQDIFVLGSDLATPGRSPLERAAPQQDSKRAVPRIRENHVQFLERAIDACEDKLPKLRNFILPGGSLLAATLHMARALARRAERKIIDVTQAEELDSQILAYANRLSDCLFVLARLANFEAGVQDVPWIPNKGGK